MLGDNLDHMESMENSAERRYEEGLQSDGKYKCECGKLFDPMKEGGPPTANPFCLPVCDDCLREIDCDHEWELVDDSFDHEFGVETIIYEKCEHCGETRKVEPPDPDYDRLEYKK